MKHVLSFLLLFQLCNAQQKSNDNDYKPRLNAQVHQARLVDSSKVFCSYDIDETVSKIDSIIIDINFKKKGTKKIALLKKSLLDKYKIKKSEIKVTKNSIQIKKENIPHYEGVSTHFITLYLNQKIKNGSMQVKIYTPKGIYFSEYKAFKTINSNPLE